MQTKQQWSKFLEERIEYAKMAWTKPCHNYSQHSISLTIVQTIENNKGHKYLSTSRSNSPGPPLFPLQILQFLFTNHKTRTMKGKTDTKIETSTSRIIVKKQNSHKVLGHSIYHNSMEIKCENQEGMGYIPHSDQCPIVTLGI